jgi:transcriptional regulator with XRE-family HTH domain
MNKIKNIGQRLRAARLAEGFKTAKSFVERFQISPATYSAHETNRNGLTTKMAQFYAECLGVSVSWLLTGQEEQVTQTKSEAPSFISADFELQAISLLDLLEKVYLPYSLAFLSAAGLQSNMKVIDACCYQGNMSFEILKKLGNQGSVYAYHDNATLLSSAITRSRLENIRNILFQPIALTEIAKLGQTQAPVDLVYCRMLQPVAGSLEHIVSSLLALLKSNGVFVLEIQDYQQMFMAPADDIFNSALHWFAQYWQKQSVDLGIGKQVYPLLKKQSVSDIQVNCAQPLAISTSTKRLLELLTAEYRAAYLQTGLVKTGQLDATIDALQILANQEETLMAYPSLLQYTCKKN